LGLDKNLIIGQSINGIFPYTYILNEIISGKNFTSKEITCQIGKKKHRIICTAKPILTDHLLTGIVLSFIRLSDAKTMNKDFSESQQEYAINMEDDNYIKIDNLPEYLRVKYSDKKISSTPLKEYERELIATTLERYGNTVRGKEMTAVFLGWSMATLYRKIKKYGL